MPAFTFEKISPPPTGRGATPVSADKKSGSVFVRIFSRLVETRAEPARRVEDMKINRREQGEPE